MDDRLTLLLLLPSPSDMEGCPTHSVHQEEKYSMDGGIKPPFLPLPLSPVILGAWMEYAQPFLKQRGNINRARHYENHLPFSLHPRKGMHAMNPFTYCLITPQQQPMELCPTHSKARNTFVQESYLGSTQLITQELHLFSLYHFHVSLGYPLDLLLLRRAFR